MQAHEQRMVEEERLLDAKIIALVHFTMTPVFLDLTETDQRLMRQTRDAMLLYSEVLADRIDRVGRDPAPAIQEMKMRHEDEVEAEIQAKALNAPRLTPALIDATIVQEAFHVFPGTTMTVCALTLRNGFIVIGESAAASPANFDAALGQKIARENARNKIWAFEGYALRERLSAQASMTQGTNHDQPGMRNCRPHEPPRSPEMGGRGCGTRPAGAARA